MDEVEFEAKAKAAFDLIEDKARQMGLYVDAMRAVAVPPVGEIVLLVDFILGDIAFSDRVQNPERHATDNVLKSMEKSMQTDEFLNERDRIQKALAAGMDPLSALDAPETDLGN